MPVKSTPIPSPSGTGATYVLNFDSDLYGINGHEHVRARVPLMPQSDPSDLAGEAPLEIVSADGDQASGGVCHDNKFTEEPGSFRVVSAKLAVRPDGNLTHVDLVYSLNPLVRCTDDKSFRPNNWNLFWMVYDGHFKFKLNDDKLDDSGPEPLITVGHWDYTGPSAQRAYDWVYDRPLAPVTEHTKITLDPVTP